MKDPLPPTLRKLRSGPWKGAVPARHQVRGGLPGAWDRIAGPGAGTAENAGSLVLGFAGVVLAPALARRRVPGRQGVGPALRVLAADLWGGAWCNNTPAAARWYHRDGQGAAQHLVFSAGHVHPSSWPDGTATRTGTGCAGPSPCTATCWSRPPSSPRPATAGCDAPSARSPRWAGSSSTGASAPRPPLRGSRRSSSPSCWPATPRGPRCSRPTRCPGRRGLLRRADGRAGQGTVRGSNP
jgi:hypothetical protein